MSKKINRSFLTSTSSLVDSSSPEGTNYSEHKLEVANYSEHKKLLAKIAPVVIGLFIVLMLAFASSGLMVQSFLTAKVSHINNVAEFSHIKDRS